MKKRKERRILCAILLATLTISMVPMIGFNDVYADEITTDSESNAEAVQYEISGTSSLAVRSEASISSTLVGALANGDIVTVLDTVNTSDGRTWGKIIYKNKECWISLKYATVVKNDADDESTSEEDTETETEITKTPGVATTYKQDALLYNYMRENYSLNSAAICGILANIWAESGFISNMVGYDANTTAAKYTAAVDDGTYSRNSFMNDGYGYGLCMWTFYTVKAELYDYSVDQNIGIGDYKLQLDFLLKTMKELTPGLMYSLQQIEDTNVGAYEAARIFCLAYEVPANKAAASIKRAKYARDTLWAKYGEGTTLQVLEDSTYETVGKCIVQKNASVYSSAGTEYAVVTRAIANVPFDVIESDEEWSHIIYNGVEGWIQTSKCVPYENSETETEGDTENTTGTTTETTTGDSYKITATTLNVRADAGTSYSVVTTVKKDAIVTVTETKTGTDGKTWGKITVNSKNGWISLAYASKVTTETTTTDTTTTETTTTETTTTETTTDTTTTETTTGGTTTTETTTTGDSYKITATSLNVRTGAGTSYSLVTTVKKDTVVTVTETKKASDGKTWGKITVNGKTGWISLAYASKVSTGTTTGSTTTGTQTTTGTSYKVTATSLYVRKGAGTSYSSLGALKNGATVTVTETKTGTDGKTWGKITFNGNTGWISLSYCTKA